MINMGGLSQQKRMASVMLKAGESRVWMNPDHLEDIKNAITRADIRKMINYGYIKAKSEKIKSKIEKKKKQGIGRRKGSKGARTPEKQKWVNTVRSLRIMLKELKDKEKLDVKIYRKLYLKIKSGAFRSRSHFKVYLKQRGIISEDRA